MNSYIYRHKSKQHEDNNAKYVIMCVISWLKCQPEKVCRVVRLTAIQKKHQ